jgi:hypothetical protein
MTTTRAQRMDARIMFRKEERVRMIDRYSPYHKIHFIITNRRNNATITGENRW